MTKIKLQILRKYIGRGQKQWKLYVEMVIISSLMKFVLGNLVWKDGNETILKLYAAKGG